jgi:hypothetical protein
MASIRQRLKTALEGGPVGSPVYAVYDWFVKNRPIDWPSLFSLGLGQISHASLLSTECPNARIVETLGKDAGGPRRDVTWITDAGELHEWYRGEWRQEYLVKSPGDYRILARALEGSRFTRTDAAFNAAEAAVGDAGVTLGQPGDTAMESRTPLQAIQIDCAGLERFSLDIADENPGLMELIQLMEERTLEKFRLIRESGAAMIKLWENLSIETMGARIYRRHLVPLYKKIFSILDGTGKSLHVHYDGKLGPIAPEIGGLPFGGIDSLTGPPEGDLSAADARALWPDTFLWLHPNLGWYQKGEGALREAVRTMAGQAGSRFCMMISEEVPPGWRSTVPAVLAELAGAAGG